MLHPPVIEVETRQRFADFVATWRKAANGRSLLEVRSSVGLMFADFADVLDLSAVERLEVFGADLSGELDQFLDA